MFEIEWDPAKAARNLRKHGIEFNAAATVFEDPLSMSMRDEGSGEFGERWVTMGQTRKGQLLVVVHTHRRKEEGGMTTVRIISARQAEPRERRRFEAGK